MMSVVFTKEGEILAREHLTKAIECDPGLAKAYSKMAMESHGRRLLRLGRRLMTYRWNWPANGQ